MKNVVNQPYIYVFYSLKSPYLPIDFVYSYRELSERYSITLKSAEKIIERRYSKKLGFTVEKVYC